jgi:septal ring factor EnvC (AmiA/AmiB activator)
MAHDTLTLDHETLQEAFHQWQAEQESLDAEWSESLAALAAYQSHLDNWQQELSRDRDELRREREEWELKLAVGEGKHDESSAQATAQLAEAREKIAVLTEQLLTRTEELREIDQRGAELTAELELARVNAKQLAADLEEHKRTLERERSAAAEEMNRMRGLLEPPSDRAAAEPREVDEAVGATDESASNRKPAPRTVGKGGPAKGSANSPVLGSIVEQFGKLRQQRATDRQSGKKTG